MTAQLTLTVDPRVIAAAKRYAAASGTSVSRLVKDDLAAIVAGSAQAPVWSAVEGGVAEGFLAAHGVTTLHYLVTRSRGREFADRCVWDVLSVFLVAPVDGSVISEAIALRWGDFEDAVCAASAKQAGGQPHHDA